MSVQDERQRALPEEVAVDLELGQRVAELADGRARGVVDEHLLGPRLRRHVVHQRDALVEEVPAAAWISRRIRSLGMRCHSRHAMNSPGISYRSCEQVRERLARRLLHRQHLDDAIADQQVVAMALDGGVRDEVVQMRVVRQAGGVDDRWRRSSRAAGRSGRRPCFVETREAELAELHLERLGLVVQRADGSVEFRFDELQRVRRPRAIRAARRRGARQKRVEARCSAGHVRRFVEQHEVERQVVQVVTAGVQVRRAALDRLVCDGLPARRRRRRVRPCA